MKLRVRSGLFLSSAGVILAQQYVISTYAGERLLPLQLRAAKHRSAQ